MRLGADPEFFLRDKTGDSFTKTGKVVPVCGMLPGADKWNPKPLPNLKAGFNIQEDNVAVEYNIPPADNKDDFVFNIQTGLMGCFSQDLINPSIYGPAQICAHLFEDNELTHPNSQVFGCEPDYNAWTGKENKRITLPKTLKNLRTAGGHVHVETTLPPKEVIRAMDLFLAVPASLLQYPGEQLRKKMYGKIGAYRPKSYGVEYRTLSNFWIFSQNHISWVWDATQRALDAVQKDQIDFNELASTIKIAVEGHDTHVAEGLMNVFNVEPVPSVY